MDKHDDNKLNNVNRNVTYMYMYGLSYLNAIASQLIQGRQCVCSMMHTCRPKCLMVKVREAKNQKERK